MKRRLLLNLIVLAMILGIVAMTTNAAEYSGNCGTGVTWNLDKETGVLTISGSGNMTNFFSVAEVPWFSARTKIKSLTVSEGVTSIGSSAFLGCTALASVSLPDSLQVIGSDAFHQCVKLAAVTIPKNVQSIGTQVFAGCKNLAQITVDSENACYTTDSSGVLYNKAMTQLLQAPGKLRGSYSIPEGVQSISSGAFYNCNYITEIHIPASVVTIAEKAFAGCAKLAAVGFAGNAPSISAEAFQSVTATVRYPYNMQWPKTARKNYGGALTWVRDPQPALAVYGKTLLLEDLVSINYYFDLENILPGEISASGLQVWEEGDYAAAFGTLTAGNATYTVKGMVNNQGHYMISSKGIPAKNMGDMIYARGYVTLTDGTTVYSDVIEYSALTYARNQYGKTTEEATAIKPVLIALMNYGAAAQVKLGYKADTPMNSFLTAEEQITPWDDRCLKLSAEDTAGKFALQTENSAAVITKIQKSLSLEGALNVNIYSTIGIDDAQEVGVLYWSEAVYASSDALTAGNAVKLATVDNGSLKQAVITDVVAKNMSNDCYVCVYVIDAEGNTHYSELVSYNAHNYAASQIAKNRDADLTALCKAIVVYGNAAESYFLN